MKWPLPWKRASGDPGRESRHEFVGRLASRALGVLELADRKAFVENSIREFFGFRRVEIMLKPEGAERFSAESARVRDVLSRVVGILGGLQKPILNETLGREFGVSGVLRAIDATHAIPISRGSSSLGLLAIDSSPRKQLSPDLEQTLLEVRDQVGIVLENSNLLQGKLALQHALAEQARMVQLGEMTARIAHEIKNPLGAIKTIIQVMQEDTALHPQYTRDLALIKSEVDRLSNTVMQLLNFARPGPGSDDAVSLYEAADSALQFLRRDIEQLHITALNDIPPDLARVPGSTAAFREIFLNLILNAIQAGGEGTRVHLQAWEGVLEDGAERFVLLVVEDDGPGISQEARDKVFLPFFTTRQRGTGLGLTIVKRDVEHLGGRVTLESPARDGRGTRFLIHLPLTLDTKEAGSQPD